MDKIRILQISDIHRMVKPKALDCYTKMRDEFLNDIKSYCQKMNCKFDHLLICGDIAYSGEQEQYEKAEAYIEKVCECIGINDSEVYVVPGNHDKQRREERPELRNLMHSGLSAEQVNDEMFSQLMRAEPDIVRSLFVPFKHYAEFCNRYDCNEMMMSYFLEDGKKHINQDDIYGYWHSILAEDLNGYCVHLYGFNTALNCDCYDWSEQNMNGHKMYLSKFAYNTITKEQGKHIYLSMMHHPTEFLANSQYIVKELNKLFQLQFFGHVHIQNYDLAPNNKAVRILSGAMDPPEAHSDEEKKIYCPTYNIVELSIRKSGKDMLHINLESSRWNEGEDKFERFTEQTRQIDIEIPQPDGHWNANEPQCSKLPVGVSKRQIRCKFSTIRNKKSVIESLYKGLYDDNEVVYINIQNFFNRIQQENRWTELWDKIK